MTNITKIAATSAISLMMVAALYATTAQTTYAGNGEDICTFILGSPFVTFDTSSVLDPDTGDFIDVWKCYNPDVDCPDNDAIPSSDTEEVPKKSALPTRCFGFGFIMGTNNPDAVLTDSVPAEWNAGAITELFGSCDKVVKGNSGKGATVLTCTPEEFDPPSGFYVVAGTVVDITTRESPSGKGFYKPTSCILYKNEGVEGFVPGETWDHDNDAGTEEVPFTTGLTDPVPVTVVGAGCQTNG